ncbi:SRPBCC family protein [Nonomuraea jiangxiensis]|uniref:Polyketide cyclase / dehydrase and lipid transport n=1 Tax=Nonomuraea jiangxiensis TaxID=633440 RepID=A0A1G8ILU0_9ACTN|nr:SRPBCC family protein [Nonomuraea jiangxiensis]SDI19865.1 Polyketide cyclase / dehydrase and lipid transport [Nonomuraea jiangxiensis]
MSTIDYSLDVRVPISVAYNQWTQFETFPEFMEGVESVRQLTDTRAAWLAEIAGVKREFETEITDQHPDERVAWRTLDKPRHAGAVTFHPLDDGTTRVTLQMEYDPEGFVETAGDWLQLVRMRVEGDMRRFKEFIESRGGETGAWRGDVPRQDAPGTHAQPGPRPTGTTAQPHTRPPGGDTPPLPGTGYPQSPAPGGEAPPVPGTGYPQRRAPGAQPRPGTFGQ